MQGATITLDASLNIHMTIDAFVIQIIVYYDADMNI